MKLLIYIFIGITFTNSLYAMENELKKYCRKLDFIYLEKKLNVLQNKSNKIVEYKWDSKIEREIINDYSECIIELNKNVRDDNNESIYSSETYILKLIKHKYGKIIYFEIIKILPKKIDDKWSSYEKVFFKDSTKDLDKLKNNYKFTYSNSLNMNGLFVTDIVYGKDCGFSGRQPLYRVKLIEILINKDKEELLNWLGSTTLEIQFYAIEGILTLKKEGVLFDKKVNKLIKLISEKKGFIHSCSGCNYDTIPIEWEYKFLIKKFNDN